MNNLLKFIVAFLLLITNYYLPITIYAVCPICTVAVGAGVGLTRYLGVDDLITGLWIGALVLSSSFWIAQWLKNKGIKFSYQLPITNLVMYISFILPLYFTQIIGHPYNTLWGIDKLLLGIILGSVVFLLALTADKKVRHKFGHQLFSYQKIIFPVSFLTIISLIIYFLV